MVQALPVSTQKSGKRLEARSPTAEKRPQPWPSHRKSHGKRRGVGLQEGGQLSCFPTEVQEHTANSLAPNQVAVVVILIVPGTPAAPVAVEVAGRVDFSPVVSLGVGSGESEKVDRAGIVCRPS